MTFLAAYSQFCAVLPHPNLVILRSFNTVAPLSYWMISNNAAFLLPSRLLFSSEVGLFMWMIILFDPPAPSGDLMSVIPVDALAPNHWPQWPDNHWYRPQRCWIWGLSRVCNYHRSLVTATPYVLGGREEDHHHYGGAGWSLDFCLQLPLSACLCFISQWWF